MVVDGKPPEHGELTGTWPAQSPEYRDVEGTLARYQPYVEEAARQGASVIVLPEASVYAEDNGASERWCAGVEGWARALDVAIVAPFFDAATPKNTLAVIDKSGVVAYHCKQHPAPGAEPPRAAKMEVGPHQLANGATLSTAICVDLDYSDTTALGAAGRRAPRGAGERLVRRVRGAPPQERGVGCGHRRRSRRALGRVRYVLDLRRRRARAEAAEQRGRTGGAGSRRPRLSNRALPRPRAEPDVTSARGNRA